MRFRFFTILFLLLMFPMMRIPSLWADEVNEQRASDAFAKARALDEKESFRKAGKTYLQVVLYTDDDIVKVNSLTSASRSFRNAGFLGSEFECVERLIKEHTSRIDFTQAVNREFEIVNAYFEGHRDAVFDWLPFIKGKDRTVEFAEAVVRNAPCADKSADVLLRLGRLYMKEQEPEKAIEKYKDVVLLHPATESARYATLELADTYSQLAQRGDGDGAWCKLAMDILNEFIDNYPDDPEVPWARKQREKLDMLTAERYHDLARYYHRTGRDDLAARYLTRVIQDYPASEQAIPSEQLLADIDETYEAPPEDAKRPEPMKIEFERNTIPMEESSILYTPESSDGKWLLPIRDLKKDIKTDSREEYQERINPDALY